MNTYGRGSRELPDRANCRSTRLQIRSIRQSAPSASRFSLISRAGRPQDDICDETSRSAAWGCRACVCNAQIVIHASLLLCRSTRSHYDTPDDDEYSNTEQQTYPPWRIEKKCSHCPEYEHYESGDEPHIHRDLSYLTGQGCAGTLASNDRKQRGEETDFLSQQVQRGDPTPVSTSCPSAGKAEAS
jgi:hypothetical protein